ncbi:MAG: 6,7-dimethyl-8-ribityllumazine synthase [Bacteroidales bacterium]
MSSKKKNLSSFEGASVADARGMRFGIVTAAWNKEVTGSLLRGAISTLETQGVDKEHILVYEVPGSFELPQGASFIIDSLQPDAVICLGCVIQGETRHFEFISQSVADGCMNLSLKTNIPVIFGVLTTENHDQAIQRAGGKHGNKGEEAAYTAIQMVHMKHMLKKQKGQPS